MIWELSHWKRTLKKSATTLRRRQTQCRWPKASLADVEQTVMVGFYAVRKLHEARKLPRALKKVRLPVTEYRCMKRPLRLFWPHVEEHYDLSHGRDRKQPIAFMCNQIIHSFVFVPVLDENTRGLSGVYVSSEDRKDEAVWFVGVDVIIDLFESAGSKPTQGFFFGPEKHVTTRA